MSKTFRKRYLKSNKHNKTYYYNIHSTVELMESNWIRNAIKSRSFIDLKSLSNEEIFSIMQSFYHSDNATIKDIRRKRNTLLAKRAFKKKFKIFAKEYIKGLGKLEVNENIYMRKPYFRNW